VAIGARGAHFSSCYFDSATGVLSSQSKARVPQDVNFVDYVWRNHAKWERNTALVSCITKNRAYFRKSICKTISIFFWL
jgi:hypothetical protein